MIYNPFKRWSPMISTYTPKSIPWNNIKESSAYYPKIHTRKARPPPRKDAFPINDTTWIPKKDPFYNKSKFKELPIMQTNEDMADDFVNNRLLNAQELAAMIIGSGFGGSMKGLSSLFGKGGASLMASPSLRNAWRLSKQGKLLDALGQLGTGVKKGFNAFKTALWDSPIKSPSKAELLNRISPSELKQAENFKFKDLYLWDKLSPKTQATLNKMDIQATHKLKDQALRDTTSIASPYKDPLGKSVISQSTRSHGGIPETKLGLKEGVRFPRKPKNL